MDLFKIIFIMLFWAFSILLLATIPKPNQIFIPYCTIECAIEKRFYVRLEYLGIFLRL